MSARSGAAGLVLALALLAGCTGAPVRQAPPVDEAQAQAWSARHLAGAWNAETLPEVPHAFSHYRLRLQPRRLREVAPRATVGDNPDLRWVARDELHAFALPAPIRKLIDSRT